MVMVMVVMRRHILCFMFFLNLLFSCADFLIGYYSC
jgi:hypothetical protein